MSEQHQAAVESLVDFPKDVGKAFLGRDWRAMALDSTSSLPWPTSATPSHPTITGSNDKISGQKTPPQYFSMEFLIRHLFQAYEHPVEGFDQIPKAFVDMMDGASQGKVIVRM